MFKSEYNIYILVIVLLFIILRKLIPNEIIQLINTEFYDVLMTLVIVFIAKTNFIMSLILLNFYIFSITLKKVKTSEFMTPQIEEVKAEPFVINKEYFTQEQPKQNNIMNDYSSGYLNLESDLYK